MHERSFLKEQLQQFQGGYTDACGIRPIKIKTVPGSGVILISGLTQGKNTGFVEAV